MSVQQLQFDFSWQPPARTGPLLEDLTWREVTGIAQGAGISGTCLVSTALHDRLDDQTLYDALWTANFMLSLNKSDTTRFALELNAELIQLKATKTHRAVRLGRANDF